LNEIIISAVELLSAKASIANINIDLTLSKEQVVIMADVEYMERVFINIIMNAIQVMEETGGTLKISIHLDRLNNRVHIIFEDTGPGIENGKVEEVFESLYTTKDDGTGLGLAMCKYIVNGHGGEISVESILGVGAKFIVVLPCI